MKKTTEQLLKADLTRLYNHIQKWYKEHPEGKGDPKDSLACYGSTTFGITYDQYNDQELTVANLTLCSRPGDYVYIEAPNNHMPIKHHPCTKHHREKSSKSEEKIVP